MDVGTLQQAISSLGFPIVCVIGLAWFVKRLWDKSQEQNEKREEKLYEIIEETQKQNEKLSETNAKFVEVLNSHTADLNTMKNDISEIKEKLN